MPGRGSSTKFFSTYKSEAKVKVAKGGICGSGIIAKAKGTRPSHNATGGFSTPVVDSNVFAEASAGQ